MLSANNLNKHGMFNQNMIETNHQEHLSRKEINDILIWSSLIFQAWFEGYLNRNSLMSACSRHEL